MRIHDELIAVTINRAVTPDTPQMDRNILPPHPMKAAGLVLALVSSLAAADIPHIPHMSLSPERIFMQISPSVVEVEAADPRGRFIRQGSGVIVEANRVTTACHMIKKVAEREENALIVRKSGNTFKATLQYVDGDRDL
jgi:S1-C subfamily serine protease